MSHPLKVPSSALRGRKKKGFAKISHLHTLRKGTTVYVVKAMQFDARILGCRQYRTWRTNARWFTTAHATENESLSGSVPLPNFPRRNPHTPPYPSSENIHEHARVYVHMYLEKMFASSPKRRGRTPSPRSTVRPPRTRWAAEAAAAVATVVV